VIRSDPSAPSAGEGRGGAGSQRTGEAGGSCCSRVGVGRRWFPTEGRDGDVLETPLWIGSCGAGWGRTTGFEGGFRKMVR
jgi:hypothetical protein